MYQKFWYEYQLLSRLNFPRAAILNFYDVIWFLLLLTISVLLYTTMDHFDDVMQNCDILCFSSKQKFISMNRFIIPNLVNPWRFRKIRCKLLEIWEPKFANIYKEMYARGQALEYFSLFPSLPSSLPPCLHPFLPPSLSPSLPPFLPPSLSLDF